jgi:hypothetical protein
MLLKKRKLREKEMKLTIFSSKEEKGYTSLIAAGVVAPLICCGLISMPNTASAMQTANTEATLGVTLSAEQDDNITLSSETAGDVAKEDDMVFHVIPALDMTHFFGDHNLNANLNGDFEKGQILLTVR